MVSVSHLIVARKACLKRLGGIGNLFAVRQAIARQVPGAVHITKEREPDRAAAFRAEVEAIDKRSQAEDARWERRGSDWQPRCGARGVRSSTARSRLTRLRAGLGRTGAGPFLPPISPGTRSRQEASARPRCLCERSAWSRAEFFLTRRQPLAEIGGRSLVEAMVDLAGVDEVVSLAPAEGWR